MGTKYRRISVIGKGSFGCCWLVESELRERCVMKEIDISRMPPQQRDEAANEVKVLSKLRHPFIIGYKESFVEEGLLCVVTEHAERGDLYRLIREQKCCGRPLEEARVLRWFTQIALALKHMHDRLVLHRDLKTQNIFLTGSGEGTAKIGDFGIARVLQHTQDCARTAIGTPYYLSPEICQEKPYNHKSDVWSLGCVLYELATLQHAFDSDSMRGLVMKILRGVPPELPLSFSAEVRALVPEMLVKDPVSRPSINQVLQRPAVRSVIRQLLQEVEQRCAPATGKPAKPKPASGDGGPQEAPAMTAKQAPDLLGDRQAVLGRPLGGDDARVRAAQEHRKARLPLAPTGKKDDGTLKEITVESRAWCDQSSHHLPQYGHLEPSANSAVQARPARLQEQENLPRCEDFQPPRRPHQASTLSGQKQATLADPELDLSVSLSLSGSDKTRKPGTGTLQRTVREGKIHLHLPGADESSNAAPRREASKDEVETPAAGPVPPQAHRHPPLAVHMEALGEPPQPVQPALGIGREATPAAAVAADAGEQHTMTRSLAIARTEGAASSGSSAGTKATKAATELELPAQPAELGAHAHDFRGPDGAPVDLLVSDRDSLSYRIEALRVYIEQELGLDNFLHAYRYLNESALSESTADREKPLEAFVSTKTISFLPLIHQLIVCEDECFGQ